METQQNALDDDGSQNDRQRKAGHGSDGDDSDHGCSSEVNDQQYPRA